MGRKKTNFKIDLPRNWDEINLKKYEKLVKLYNETDNKPSVQQLIAILSEQSIEEINKMPALIIEEIMNNLLFLKDEINREPKNMLKIGDDEYFINYMEDLKFGEYVDIQTIMKDDSTNYSTILAILCRKKDEIYNDKFIADILPSRIEMFENQPISNIYPIIAFFLTLSKVSKMNTVSSLKGIKEAINLCVNYIENLQKTGLGKKHFLNSQKKKLITLKKSLNNI